MRIKINIRKIHSDAKNPITGKKEIMELTCVTKNTNQNYIEYGTGISIDIPKGYAGILFPMDSIYKRDLIVKDSIGVIESNNKEEIKIKFYITEDTLPNTYHIGDKIAKLIILPVAKFQYIWNEK